VIKIFEKAASFFIVRLKLKFTAKISFGFLRDVPNEKRSEGT